MAYSKVAIITEGMLSRNGTGFLAPIIKNLERLKEIGLVIHFIHISRIQKKIEADIIIIESQSIKKLYQHNISYLIELLTKLKGSSNKLILYDLNDDSCTGYFKLLPYIDSYCKSYLLHDKNLYTQNMYGGRIWTDYYHEKFGIKDKSVYINSPVTSKEDLNKIRKGYLLGLVDYSEKSIFAKSGKLRESLRRAGLLKLFMKGPRENDFTPANLKRTVPLSCRISTNYPIKRESLTFHREQTAKLLSDQLMTDKLKRKSYLSELRNSKLVMSPFGWGEINVARDYEVAMAGAILVKPNIAHLDTFPDIFNIETTLQFKWDFSDLIEKIETTLEGYDQKIDLAENLQNQYKFYMCSNEGQQEFCSYFKNMT